MRSLMYVQRRFIFNPYLTIRKGVIINDAGEYEGFIEQSNPNQHDLYNF
jgi:hypothetical protein